MGSADGAGRRQTLADYVRDIPDFPRPGVVFKDITPLLGDAAAFAATVEGLARPFEGRGVTRVLGIEARGFIPGAAVAARLGTGFVPVRKAGKLPWEVEKTEYVLEYGTDLLEIHRDAVGAGERVLVVDDVMATGGTAAAAIRLTETLGGSVVGLAFIIELAFLGGRAQLGGRETLSLLTYDEPAGRASVAASVDLDRGAGGVTVGSYDGRGGAQARPAGPAH